MSSFQEGNRIAKKAGADLSAKQYFIVSINSSEECVLANAQTVPIFGILQNAPEQNDTADIKLAGSGGTSKVIAAEPLSVGVYVTADASGKAIATTTGGDFVVGRVVKAAAADGDTVEIALLGFRY